MKKIISVLENSLYALEKSRAFVPRDIFDAEFSKIIEDIKEITFRYHMKKFSKKPGIKSSDDIDTIPQEFL